MANNYQVKNITINGMSKRIICHPDDTLLNVLRNQLKMTGTKRGCECGQCGACNIILNGKVVRSCITKMKNVPELSEILTIEGLGTPEHLHAIQWAFIANNAIQCGFCTPGFIMSAKGLLDINLCPTREEIRTWFQKHWNACRCTGYKQIVDAVMDAAAILRGEKEIVDFAKKLKPGQSIWGTNYPRPSDKYKATGKWPFGDDAGIELPGDTLYAALVHVDVNHAYIKNIDISAAEQMPGVFKVVTAKDIYANGGTNKLFGAQLPHIKGSGWERPILCDEKIFMWGDVVAIVCARTYEEAENAKSKIKVDLEILPALMNIEDAIKDDAIRIHPNMPNIYYKTNVKKGEDANRVNANLPYVVEDVFYLQRQPHLTLENDVGFGYWDEDGNLTIQSKHVWIYKAAAFMARGIGINPSKIRIIQNNAGASFGYKLGITNEALIAAAVIATGRPIFCRYDTKHHITYTPKRAPALMHVTIGADKQGKIQALEHSSWVDHGPYSELSLGLISKFTQYMGSAYNIPNITGNAYGVYTNQKWNTAFRAFGAPQVHTAQEIIVDMLAAKVGIDPLEFRYINCIKEGDTFPFGQSPDVYPFHKMLDILRPKYKEALIRAQKENSNNIKKGVGIALGIYNSNSAGPDKANSCIELMPDNSVTIYNTWEEHGQGADIGIIGTAHKALSVLGLSPDKIRLCINDTHKCPDSGPAGASRSQVMVGQAIIDSCNKLLDAMRKNDGTYRTYQEMVRDGISTTYLGTHTAITKDNHGTIIPCIQTDSNNGQGLPYTCLMYAVFMAEVDVYVETGAVSVSKLTLIDDVGVINNYGVVNGQMYGGLAQGVGLALKEDFEDPSKYNNLITCGLPYINDIPDNMEIVHMETPREFGPFGASGAGELPLTSPHAAIINAIYNACGVRITKLPAKKEQILKLLNKK